MKLRKPKQMAAALCAAFLAFAAPGSAWASRPEIPVAVPAGQVTADDAGSGSGPAANDAGSGARPAFAGLEISAPCGILMEASTGTVLWEKNADEAKNPASVTKIMTLLLIFDAIREGKISLSDQVVTSARAKSMGGSQVFLEEGEVQSVETLIKCIVIASGNDASVAMAEYIAGDESAFVRMMNERAAGLGMTHTNFEDCCGLTDSASHAVSARDIAIMSRELITKHPEIFNYSTIWMENITHVTRQGSKEFGLSNTNKLLKMAAGFRVTGLKTGSTSTAKYCLSATAEKDGVELIAVVLAAPDYKSRFADAMALLNCGFAGCRLYRDDAMPQLPAVKVLGGVAQEVPLSYGGEFTYLDTEGKDFSAVEREFVLEESLSAPVKEGMKAGELRYRLGGKDLGHVDIFTAASVEKAGFKDYLKRAAGGWMLNSEAGHPAAAAESPFLHLQIQ